MYIDDEAVALNQLDSISYFRLASYWRSMEADSKSHRFYPNSRFEDVIELYLFDRKLRGLIFTAIQDIEIALRTRVIHHFSMKYGAFWFMNKTLFKDAVIYENCINSLRNELERTREDFIKEHFAKYDSPSFPPAWKTLEVVSFGTLSKLYCNMRDVEVKKKVARDFHLPQYLYVENWIKCASVLRNSCAHHARLWNRRFPLMPKIPKKLPQPWICDTCVRPVKIYAHLCYLAYLDMGINPNCNFRAEVVKLLSTKPRSILRAMGFPADWLSEALWTTR